MDKILAIILVFVAMMVIMAAILAMGAVPTIFKNAEKINQTQQFINLTLVQQHEDNERDQQKFQIIQQTNKSINQSLSSLEDRIYKFMNESQTRSQKAQDERQIIINSFLNESDKEQQYREIEHSKLYNLLDSVADRNYNGTLKSQEILNNITEELKEIKSRLP